VWRGGGDDRNAGPLLASAGALGAVVEAGAVKPLLERGVRAGFAGAGVLVVSGAAEPAGLVVVVLCQRIWAIASVSELVI
jgi:hypothetical protein